MELEKIISTELWQSMLRALLILGVGLPIIYFVSKSAGAYVKKRTSEHIGLMTQKSIFCPARCRRHCICCHWFCVSDKPFKYYQRPFSLLGKAI